MLEQVAPLAVGVGDRVLLELGVGVAGVRAGEVDVAHQRRGERERRRAALRRLAGQRDDRVPQVLLADAVGVDVVLERQPRAGAPHRGAAHEGDLLERDRAVLEQRDHVHAVVLVHLVGDVGDEAPLLLQRPVGGDLLADQADARLGDALDAVEHRGADAPALGLDGRRTRRRGRGRHLPSSVATIPRGGI